MKLAHLGDDHRGECRVCGARIVENQSERERGLRMLPVANGIRELRQPRLEARDHRRLEWLERRRQRSRTGRLCFPQLSSQLQQPGQSVWAFERLAPGGVEVGHL